MLFNGDHYRSKAITHMESITLSSIDNLSVFQRGCFELTWTNGGREAGGEAGILLVELLEGLRCLGLIND